MFGRCSCGLKLAVSGAVVRNAEGSSGPEADLRFAPKRTQSNPRLSRMCLQRNLDFSDEDNEVSNE